MRILIVDTFYGPYLERLYADGALAQQPWAQQHKAHFAGGFGTGDAYSHGLGLLGVPAIEIVANSALLQQAWAHEHQPALLQRAPGGEQLLAILEAQIRWWKPTVLYVQDINWLPAAFLKYVKPLVEMVVGQNACPLAPGLDLSSYDLLLTSLPHYVGKFRAMGVDAAYFPIGFDERLLQKHRTQGPRPQALTFVGGLGGYHSQGTQMLEAIAQELPLEVWGYGGQQLPADSILRKRWRGEAWADDMYALLASSQITLNRHIDIAEGYANNMRLYEATGMGACLLTDNKLNLPYLFEPDWEVVTYSSAKEAIGKAKELLEYPAEARKIANRGHRRTLKEHTYKHRAEELALMLQRRARGFSNLKGQIAASTVVIADEEVHYRQFNQIADLDALPPYNGCLIYPITPNRRDNLTGLRRWQANTSVDVTIALDCLNPAIISEATSPRSKSIFYRERRRYKTHYRALKLDESLTPPNPTPREFTTTPSGNPVLLVGSKPYFNLNLTPLIDSFDNIVRFNLAMPYINNGTARGELVLNNHLHDNLNIKRISKEEFISHYESICDRRHLESFYHYYHRTRKRNHLYFPTVISDIASYLSSIDYPQGGFTSFPRVGINTILYILMHGLGKPYLIGFSIREEQRNSYYASQNRKPNELLHSSSQEYSLVTWLSKKGLIDTTLCLLEDREVLDADRILESHLPAEIKQKIYISYQT